MDPTEHHEGFFTPGGAETYDSWYDTVNGRSILATEIQALRPLIDVFPQPRLEVGVGTGRFAQALGGPFGLDPSTDALRIARRRGVLVAAGTGEEAPFASQRFGAVLLAFTLCFLADSVSALLEAHRLLIDGGGLVAGFLPRGTPWAELYAHRGRQGHPSYRHARFYTAPEVEQHLTDSGFRVTARRSTLRQPPGLERYEVEPATDHVTADAGFVAISAVKESKRWS